MTKTIAMPEEELAHLEGRLRTLAQEKAHLQLLVQLMGKMSLRLGQDTVIGSMLQNVLGVIGCTNVALYYRIDEAVFLWDIDGQKGRLEAVDDDLVRQVFVSHAPVVVEHDSGDTGLAPPEFGKAYTVAYPLLVGEELIGVCKMEGLQLDMREFSDELPLFFSYAALLVKHEILGHARLTQANDELNLANAELRRQERFVSSLLENIPDGVVACDANGTLSLFNRAARDWHGLDPMALPPEQWAEHYDLYGPDGTTPLTVDRVPLARAFRGEKVVNAEMTIAAKGQPLRHILANAGPFFDDAGQRLGAVAVMLDITARKQAEEALLAAKATLEASVIERTEELRQALDQLQDELEERRVTEGKLRARTTELDSFFNVALDLLCIADIDGRFHRLNLAWETTFGLGRHELMAGTFFDFIHPDDLTATKGAIAALAAQQEVVNFVNRYRCRDGSYRWIEWRTVPAGPLIYAAARDITERIQTEAALRQQNEVIERIFAMVTTCIAYLDRDFNFIRVNDEYAAADGNRPEELVGKNHFDLYPNAENEAIFRRVVATGEQYIARAKPFEYHEHPERGLSYWDWSLTPVKGSDGEVEAVILSLVNVTERITAQEELSRLNRELERRVQERTAELEEKNRELARMNKLFVGRELRMIELKESIRRLEARLAPEAGP